MEENNIKKALLITSKLLGGEEISKTGDNFKLYEEYSTNSQVYDIVMMIVKDFNLRLYEYNYKLFITSGDNNRVFGYSNEELKRMLGLRLNKELFLCYMIMYSVMTLFYNDSASFTYLESTSLVQIMDEVDSLVAMVIAKDNTFSMTKTEESNFKTVCLLWDELPKVFGEDMSSVKASRNSRAGYVKMVMNFLTLQDLFLSEGDRYYPKDKFKALVENYFEENKGRIYTILNGEDSSDATY